jgi:hypothetical protein
VSPVRPESQAIDEVQAAVKLPEHRESRRLLDHLQQAAAPADPPPRALPADAETPTAPVDLVPMRSRSSALVCNRSANACMSATPPDAEVPSS